MMGMSVKDAARHMNVSERSVYMARKIARLRPDLVPAIQAGTLTLNAAMAEIERKPKPTSWDRLVKAWNAATDDERERLIELATNSQPEPDQGL